MSAPTTPLAEIVVDAVAGVTHLPDEVVDHAGSLMLDAFGVALAARREASAHQLRAALQAFGTDSDPGRAGEGRAASAGSSVLGLRERLPPRDAALLNGALIHGLDFDDTHGPAAVHPSGSVLPAAIATAEALGSSGRELLHAYSLGVELTVRLGLTASGAFHDRGIHPTGLLGTFGAALACARLHGLDRRATVSALGIALSLAPVSLMEFMAEGVTSKRLHTGWAAVAGMTAAGLAASGVEGPRTSLEGPRGLFRSLLGDRDGRFVASDVGPGPFEEEPTGDLEGPGLDPAVLTEAWGSRWHLLDVEIKRYPACHLIHPFLDALEQLRQQRPIHHADVVSATCGIAPAAIDIVCEPRADKLVPATPFAAQFSLPYVVAAAMVHGSLGVDQFTAAALEDDTVRDLASRVHHTPRATDSWTSGGELVIQTRDGALRATSPGAPESTCLRAQVKEKFRVSAPGPGGESDLAALETAIEGLRGDGDGVGGLAAAMRGITEWTDFESVSPTPT